MGYENISEIQPLLQIREKVHNLRLHRNIECGNRFVENNQLWLKRDGPRNADPLALAPGKFMGVTGGMVLLKPHEIKQLSHTTGDFIIG